MVEQLRIRPAVVDDEAALTSMSWRLTAFALPAWRKPEHIAEADSREMIAAVRVGSADNEVFIAERSGMPVGCLHVLEMTDFFGLKHAHVSVLATTAEAEGSGVGRALIDYADEWATRRGLAMLTLNVFASNDRARRFYERAGYAAEMLKYVKKL